MFKTLIQLCVVLSVCWCSSAHDCCPPDKVFLHNAPPHACQDQSGVITGNILNCKHNTSFILSDESTNFTVNEDGNLVLGDDDQDSEPIEPELFCVGKVRPLHNASSSPLVRFLVLCDEGEEAENPPVVHYLSLVSALFLFITAIVYAVLPEIRDLQGKSIVSLCISFGFGLSILAAMNLVDYSDMNLCAVRGFFTYFFLLSAFFWMNSISIQILCTLSRPSVRSGWREFLWYSVYAWGSPMVLTLVTILVNYVEGDHKRPGIGLHHQCWFASHKQQWIYMYSVMSLLVLANIAIFVYASVLLFRTTFSSNNIKALRYKFMLMLRLFIVMGLPWIFEMAGSLSKKHIIWVILDIFNILQGLLIFLILVVFRKRVMKAMHRRGWLCCLSGLAEKYLARAEDDEDCMVEHTAVMSMTEKS